MIAGILLVVVLLAFKITVDTGLLNGLIFYANIIGADSSTFFSGLLPSTKFHLALVSWLNLEVEFSLKEWTPTGKHGSSWPSQLMSYF